MRNFVQFASDKVYFCSALLNTLLQITPPTAPLPPLISGFTSNMKKTHYTMRTTITISWFVYASKEVKSRLHYLNENYMNFEGDILTIL